MRKYAVLVALALVVALAVPTSAAVTLGGSIKSTFTYKAEGEYFFPDLTLTITPATVATADPNKAYVKFEPWFKAVLNWSGSTSDYGAWNVTKIDYTSYMLFKGAYFTGGSEITTKIGYLGTLADFYSTDKKSYLSKDLDLYDGSKAVWIPEAQKYAQGVSITGGKVAGMSVDLYYLQPASGKNYFVAIGKKDQIANRIAYRKDDGKYRYTFDVNKYPLTSDLKVYGYVDYNGLAAATPEQRWKVGAELKASEDAVFDAYYRYDNTYDANGTFKLTAGELKPTVVVGYKKVDAVTEGIYASALCDIANLKVGAKYDDTTKVTNLVAGNMYAAIDDFIDKIADSRDNYQVETGNSYGAVLTIKDSGNELRVGTTQDLVKLLNLTSSAKLYARVGATLDLSNSANNVTWGQLYGQTDITTIPGLAKVTVHGRVHVANNADTRFGVGAAYTAPNGVAFRAGYNWYLGKAYNDVANYINTTAPSPTSPTSGYKGFVIDASKTITF